MYRSALTPHNRAVLQEAEDLEERGWNVKADHLGNYPTPEKIAGRRPDIVATKKGGRRIVEIKKREGQARSEQVETFKRSARQLNSTRFYLRIIDGDGERVGSVGNPPGDIINPQHRKGILNEAKDLSELGWKVRANTEGNKYPCPEKLGKKNGHVPDIHATKPGHTRIVEIETAKSKSKGKKKRKTFRRSAAQQKNTIFYWRVVSEAGRRSKKKSFDNVPGDVL